MPWVLAQLDILHPARAVYLALVVLLALFMIRGVMEASRSKRWLLFVIRAALCSLLVIALTVPALRYMDAEQTIAVVLDQSGSMSAFPEPSSAALTAAARQVDAAALVGTFGNPDDDRASDDANDTDSATDTDSAGTAAGAVLAAAGRLGQDRLMHLMIYSDGKGSSDLFAVAEGAGQPLVVLPPLPASYDEVLVEQIRFPFAARPDETIAIAVTLRATAPNAGSVSLYRDDQLVQRRDIDLDSGRREVVFSAPADARDEARFRVELQGFRDTFEENNRYEAYWIAAPRARVLLVSTDPAATASYQRLFEQAGYQAARQPPSVLVKPAVLAMSDLIAMLDVAEADLPDGGAAALRRYVEGGGGLIWTGGVKVFGRKRFAGGQLEQFLPVSAAPLAVEPKKAGLALVLVIDKSESMQYEDRLVLAKEAAKNTVQLLDARDQVGVLAFGTTTQWVSEIIPSGDKRELLQRIDTLQVEGETNMYPALEKSFLALEQMDADYRHIILLTDGVSSPGDFDEAAKRMADRGITLTTVSVSSGAEQTVLKDIARIAGGRHYHCEDPKELPTVLAEETRTAVAAIGPQKVPAFELRPLPRIDIGGAPPLSSYVATTPKPDAELDLLAGEGDPLLAWRKLGSGQTAVVVCDRQSLDQDWRSWADYGKFWRHLAARLVRRNTVQPSELSARHRGGGKFVATADMVDERGGRLHDAVVELRWSSDAGQGAAAMRQVAPGRYQAAVNLPAAAPVSLAANLAAGAVAARAKAAPAYDAEWRDPGVDRELLAGVALSSGGRLATDSADALRVDNRTLPKRRHLWPRLLIAAACLLVVDAAIRRLISTNVPPGVSP